MASRTLFPPVINTFEPAFVVGGSSVLRVYFSYPAYSSVSDFSNITLHAAITRKDDVKVVKDDNYQNWTGGRIRANGIIMNLVPQSAGFSKNNYYYVEIKNEDLKSSVNIDGKTFNGWIPGWEYKVQLRFATVAYGGQGLAPASYLQNNSDYFSEWSTFCSTKAIGNMVLDLPMFNFRSNQNAGKAVVQSNYFVDNINFVGTLKNEIESSNEYYQSYKVQLYVLNNLDQDINDAILLEDSGDIYISEISKTIVQYNFRANFEESQYFAIVFSFVTNNGYKLKKPYIFKFQYLASQKQNPDENITLDLATVDYDIHNLFVSNAGDDDTSHTQSHYQYLSSIGEEEDEGRIGLKIWYEDRRESEPNYNYTGNLCIRRTDQTSNFELWDDIKIFNYKEETDLREVPVFFDYTVQSGIWYQYGVQEIFSDGSRGVLIPMEVRTINIEKGYTKLGPVYVQRLFDFAFLLGQNNQQLKIPFDFDLNNYKVNVLENKVETIGSKYPFISRNAAVEYRTISISGIISYWMDENNTFLKKGKTDLYTYKDTLITEKDYPEELLQLYSEFNNNRRIGIRDFTYEKDFREAVMAFFLDGKPKLFKSPSEGNMIVRLMDTSCSPKKELGRLIYSVSATAHEIAAATMKNYLSYGFYDPGTYSTGNLVTKTNIGQLQGTFNIGSNNKTTNLIDLIYEKYDAGYNENINGVTRRLKYIDHVSITIDEDKPLLVKNNQGNSVMGYNVEVVSNGTSNLITLYSPMDTYNLGSDVKVYCEKGLGNSSELYIYGDEDQNTESISATINFFYTYAEEPAKEQKMTQFTLIEGVGQVFESAVPNESKNLLEDVYNKNYLKTDELLRQIQSIYKITIEAEPYTKFKIVYGENNDEFEFEINQTGILNLYNIENVKSIFYIQKRYLKTMYNEDTLCDDSEALDEDTSEIELINVFGEKYKIYSSTDISITYFYQVKEESYGYY